MFKFLKKAFQDFTDKALKPEKLSPTKYSSDIFVSVTAFVILSRKLVFASSFCTSTGFEGSDFSTRVLFSVGLNFSGFSALSVKSWKAFFRNLNILMLVLCIH